MKPELASEFCQEIGDVQPAFRIHLALSTMQLGHVWLIQDSVHNNDNVEHFLAKVFRSNQFSTRFADEVAWEVREDLPKWLLTLDIQPTTRSDLQATISMALSDLESADEDIDIVEEARECLRSVTVPLSGWVINETVGPRNPVGSTYIVMFETGKEYFFLEVHIES